MSRLLRVLAVLSAVAAVALVAAWLLLPGFLDGAVVRERVADFGRDALQRDVRYDGLSIGLLPLSLLVEAPVIAGATPDAAPFLRADRIRLHLAVAPLFAGAVVVDALELDGAEIHLARGPDGVALPGSDPAAAESPEPESDEPASLAIRRIGIRDARIVFADAVVSPPTTWDLRDVDLTLRGDALDAPIEIEGSASLDTGSLRLAGTAQIGGDLSLDATLVDVAVAPLGPYLGGASALAGRVSGTAAVRGPAASPSDVELDLTLDDADVRLGELHVTGTVAVGAKLGGGLAAPTGPFRIDATPAELRYGGAYTKPAGTPAHVEGEVVQRDGRADLDYQLRIKNLDATGRLELGERVRLLASGPPVELEGWGALIGFLEPLHAEGPLVLDDLEMLFSPFELHGRAQLEGVTLPLAGDRRGALHGDLVATGDALETRDVVLQVADETLSVEARLDLRDPQKGFRVRASGSDLNANGVVVFFGGKAGFLEGRLSADADLTGAFTSEEHLLDTLDGRVRLVTVDGRIGDVSLLSLAIERLRVLDVTSALTGGLLRGQRLGKVRDTHFQELSATFQLADGLARTDDFRLVSATWTAELEGTIALQGLGLDMTGRIVLGEQFVRSVPGPWKQALGGVIPLASVRGTFVEPEVGLPKGLGSRLTRVLGTPIGVAVEGTQEAGSAIGGAVRGVLGKRPRLGRRQPAPDPAADPAADPQN